MLFCGWRLFFLSCQKTKVYSYLLLNLKINIFKTNGSEKYASERKKKTKNNIKTTLHFM